MSSASATRRDNGGISPPPPPPENAHIARIKASEAYRCACFNMQRSCWTYKALSAQPTDAATALRGVRRVLTDRLWPSYDYKMAEALSPTTRAMRVRTGVRGARGGRNRGKAVHEQLHAVATMGWQQAQRFYASRHVRMEPLVVALLTHFHEQHMRVVAAEVPVYDEREPLRVGSSVDLVCAHNADGRLVLIELKVGGDNYWNKASGTMEADMAPFYVPNSPINQAMVQLLAYKMLFERCYGAVVPREAIESYRVIFVGESGIMHRVLTAQTADTLTAPTVAALAAPPPAAASAANRQNNRARR